MAPFARRRGMTTPLVLAVILALAAVGGAVYFVVKNDSSPAPIPSPSSDSGDAMEREAQSPVGATFVPSGTVLAGTTSPFVDFNKDDYALAISQGRVVMLYFYANWCPICKVEITRTEAAFNELQLANVVGFRVNWGDNETDEDEESLARQFGIAYQHTKVILKGGQQVLKNGETWSKERYIQELTNAVK